MLSMVAVVQPKYMTFFVKGYTCIIYFKTCGY